MAENNETEEFLGALAMGLGDGERLIACGFVGDPDKADVHAWRPRPWAPGKEWPLGPAANGYVTVAAFGQAEDGSWRRRKETFRGALALMVDDVGTKVSVGVIEPLRPTALVETSPGNFQAWYMLREPLRDRGRFDALIRAFIANKLLGSDPGMSGVTRVGRVPGHVNAKPKYLSPEGFPWRVRLRECVPSRRYSPEELIEAFGLELRGTTEPRGVRLVPDEAPERIRQFLAHYKWLAGRGMLKSEEPDASGWIQVTCPWMDNHTNRADTGAALREPHEENGFYGAWKCHHGGCINRDWAALTDWIMDETAEELERNNAR